MDYNKPLLLYIIPTVAFLTSFTLIMATQLRKMAWLNIVKIMKQLLITKQKLSKL